MNRDFLGIPNRLHANIKNMHQLVVIIEHFFTFYLFFYQFFKKMLIICNK